MYLLKMNHQATKTWMSTDYFQKSGVMGSYTEGIGISINQTINTSHRSLCTSGICGKVCQKKIQQRDYIYVPGEAIFIYTSPIHEGWVPQCNIIQCITIVTAWTVTVGVHISNEMIRNSHWQTQQELQLIKWSNLSVAEGDPFTCDSFHPTNALRAEAAVAAVKTLNEQLGTKFGLLVVDSCYSTPAILKKLTEILSGEEKEKVAALVGGYSSHITVEVSSDQASLSFWM